MTLEDDDTPAWKVALIAGLCAFGMLIFTMGINFIFDYLTGFDPTKIPDNAFRCGHAYNALNQPYGYCEIYSSQDGKWLRIGGAGT